MKFAYLFTLLAFYVLCVACPLSVLAHGELTDPVARTAGDNHVVTDAPCGPIPKGPAVETYVAGSSIRVSWNVDIVHESSEASFYLLDTDLDNKDVVYTLAEGIPFDQVQQYDTELQLPEGVPCNNCTLQWVYTSVAEKVTIFNCADVEILDGAAGEGSGNNTDDTGGTGGSGGAGGTGDGGDDDGVGEDSGTSTLSKTYLMLVVLLCAVVGIVLTRV